MVRWSFRYALDSDDPVICDLRDAQGSWAAIAFLIPARIAG
jgi:hypothetical protein